MQTSDGLIDVRRFGAISDGKTDNTSALQSAIDAVAAAQGTLFVPEGVFLTSTLRLRPHVGLAGNPTWSYRDSGGSVLKLCDASASSLLDLTDATGATISGLSLDGSKIAGKTHGIVVDNEKYTQKENSVTIERCRIAGFSGDGVRLNRIWHFFMRSNLIIFNAGDGIWFRGWDGFLLDNNLSYNGRAGFGGYDENASITMTGNRIEFNHGPGVVICGGTHYNLASNYIDGCGGPGLSIGSRSEVPSSVITASGNLIYRCGQPDMLPPEDPYASCHACFRDVAGLVFTSNTLNIGKDGEHKGQATPRFGIVVQNLCNSVIKDNAMHCGATERLIVDLGGHQDSIIKDNVGCLFVPGRTPDTKINSIFADMK